MNLHGPVPHHPFPSLTPLLNQKQLHGDESTFTGGKTRVPPVKPGLCFCPSAHPSCSSAVAKPHLPNPACFTSRLLLSTAVPLLWLSVRTRPTNLRARGRCRPPVFIHSLGGRSTPIAQQLACSLEATTAQTRRAGLLPALPQLCSYLQRFTVPPRPSTPA